jgi:hypothetical protein
MHIFHLLSLATAASAISIRFWPWNGAQSGNNCNLGQVGMGCEGLEPNTCCYSGVQYSAVGLYEVPDDWKVYYKGYKEKLCSEPAYFEYDNVPGTSRCGYDPKGGPIRSAAYAFRNAKGKRGEGGCRKADTLYMADGMKYTIGHLDDAMRQHLVG